MEIKRASIAFQNNNAVAVFPPANAAPEDVLNALDLGAAAPIIMIIGGDSSGKPDERLMQLFSRGIARAAASTNAMIIDAGTKSAAVSSLRESLEDRGFRSLLIGVAPADLVDYPNHSVKDARPLDPNHSHFVLVEGKEVSSAAGMKWKLAKNLAKAAPGVAILAGGEATAKSEVLFAVRQSMPILVIKGSGGLADEIANASEQSASLPNDSVMAEIIADGRLHRTSVDDSVKCVEYVLLRALGGDNILMNSWERFADYDLNAILQQRRFNYLQVSILVLGVGATALALIKQVAAPHEPLAFGWWLVQKVLIIVPILLTVLLTATNRFKQGNKWLLLRSSAEAIKREIYRYRARANEYSPTATPSAEQQLAQKIEGVTRRLMQTDVNTSALTPYDRSKGFPPSMYAAKGRDDGFSVLTPDHYIELRLGDQLNYFKNASLKLERRLKQFQWLIFLIGGLATFLSAINLQVWIALTTAIVAALTTYLSYRQTENTLMKYNQTSGDLENVKGWWISLRPESEKAKQENIDKLVTHTEQVLESELDGWIQSMQNALAELRKEQTPPSEKDQSKKPEDASEGPPAAEQPVVEAKSPPASSGEDEEQAEQKEQKKEIETTAAEEEVEQPVSQQPPADVPPATDEPAAEEVAKGKASGG